MYYGALRAVDMDTRAAAAVGSAGGVTAVSLGDLPLLLLDFRSIHLFLGCSSQPAS